jgi:transcriptional regulator of acetoin/glycerol metabolism
VRERPEDLPAIVDALLAPKGVARDRRAVEIEAMERMLLAPWTSIIRELAAVLHRIAMAAAGRIAPSDAEKVLGAASVAQPSAHIQDRVQATLQRCGGNESLGARELGVTRGKLSGFLAGSGR